MKEKSIKSNIIWLLIFIIIIIISAVLICCVNNVWKSLCGYLLLLSILGIIIDIIVFIQKNNINKDLKNLPYGFDYKAELIVYKNIGRDKKEKAVKTLKSEFQIPNVYTEWREQLIKRNEKIKDNENFYHFLKRHLINSKKFCELLIAITIPVEIATLTILCSINGGQLGSLFDVLVSVVALAIIFMLEFFKYKHEIEFTEDVIEILCPEFVSEGNRKLNK